MYKSTLQHDRGRMHISLIISKIYKKDVMTAAIVELKKMGKEKKMMIVTLTNCEQAGIFQEESDELLWHVLVPAN